MSQPASTSSTRGSKAQASAKVALSLEGKVAIVTGAESGIGRGVAIGLGRARASVIVNYLRSRAEAEETVRLITEAGAQAVAIKGDISLSGTAAKLVSGAYKSFGRLDVVINNAGIHRYQYLADVKESDWDAQLSVNLKGPFLLCQKVVAEWRRRKVEGRIVNITSCGSQTPFLGSAAYNASKAGLLGLTRQLALELAPEGIRVNAVAPGVVHTAINDSLLHDPKFLKAWENAIPARRVGCPQDLAGAVVFLCSESSAYITGQQLNVDGGWGINMAWGVPP